MNHNLLQKVFIPYFPPDVERLKIGRACWHGRGDSIRIRKVGSSSAWIVGTMSFSGTQDKCKACDKTVHFIDLLTADSVPYHKTCFKCSHCKGNLTMCSYSSMDGVLYCKPHFEQLFKETGNFSKNFQTAPKSEKELTRTPSRVSSMFSGTQDKCAVCNKTAYPLEKITVEGENYHKTCFKCSPGGCTITPSTYAALDGILYCKHHFAQLFMEKGCYNHLLTKTASMRKSSADPVIPPEVDLTAAEPEPEAKPQSEAEPEPDATPEQS